MNERSCLSDRAILRHLKQGTILIEPFVKEHLGTASYDVTLGEHYFRERESAGGSGLFNPYDEEQVRRLWIPHTAKTVREEAQERQITSNDQEHPFGANITLDDQVIIIAPGETILAHTSEFIGGRNRVTTMMKARSSLGRNFIEICKCAGWGDVGYTNRWTMEITNNSRHYHIPLVVGRRIAQIVFFETELIIDKGYEQTGKYQQGANFEELKTTWTPDSMIPKMWKDREVTN